MGDPETFLMVGFAIIIVLFFVMLAVGIPRGRNMQNTNEKIEANQRRMMELSERQAVALERIAQAVEARNTA